MGVDKQLQAATSPCLLVNPRSFRASRAGLARRVMQLARAAGLDVHEVVDPVSLCARLDMLRAQDVQQIWILAGDGTIHALAEYLAETSPGWSPALLLLAGGRANVVPREIGGYPAMPALRRALTALRAGLPLREEHLPTLKISQAGHPTRHGFVFAGALVYHAVRLTADNRAAGRGWWRHSWFSDPYILLRWAVRTLVLRHPLPPLAQVTVRLAGGGELAGPMRVLVASTLAMRNALYNPFASRGAGPVRFTAVAIARPSIWGMLPALLKGRFTDRMDPAHGVLSGRSHQVEVGGVSAFALDGELFTADPALPMVFTSGVSLRLLLADP